MPTRLSNLAKKSNPKGREVQLPNSDIKRERRRGPHGGVDSQQQGGTIPNRREKLVKPKVEPAIPTGANSKAEKTGDTEETDETGDRRDRRDRRDRKLIYVSMLYGNV